jgi:hypothetical protein
MSSYERKVLGQIRDFLLQESLNQAKQFSQMQFTLNRLEKLMSTTSTVVQSILDNTAKTISDLGIATTDLKQLLADQATAITTLQQLVAAGTASPQFTADQLTGLQASSTSVLAAVDTLDAAIKAADVSLTAANAPAAPAAPADPAPVAADPAAPAAADPAAAAPAATSTLTPGGVLVHGQTDPNAPAT